MAIINEQTPEQKAAAYQAAGVLQPPQPQPQPQPQLASSTGSIVDYLGSINQPSDFASRANLAKQRGITDYVGTAEQNTQLLNTLRAEGDKGAPKPKTQPTAQPGAIQPVPTATGGAPAAVIQPEQAATVSFDDLMAQFGIQPSERIEDIVASISKLYGFDEVNEEIKKLDKEFEDAAEKENMDPWISEGTRSRRLEIMENKYETKKKNLLDRLSVRSDIIGKSISAYNTEREYKQQMLFKALDLRQKQMKVEQDKLKYAPGDIGKPEEVYAPNIPGLTKSQARDVYTQATPPDWFRQGMENELRMSILPDKLQVLWNTVQGKYKEKGIIGATEETKKTGERGLKFEDF